MDDSAHVHRTIAFISASILAWVILVIYKHNTDDPIRYPLLKRKNGRMKYLWKLYCGEINTTSQS
jgi:hypothetical protein